MRINNNMMAMNANRQLGINNTGTAKSLEKLSSGFRINRAGDDAAGLSISEKMRGQIRGLNMASKNSQDGISLIQTAEGALDETHAILQRMRELAVQSANDTNVEVDRAALQDEMNQLRQEIDRIGNNTEFNTQKLLDNTFANKKFHIGANEGQDLEVSINDMRADALKINGEVYKAEDVDATNIEGLQVRSLDGEKVKIKFEEAGDKDTKTGALYNKDTKEITVTLAKDTDITATKADVKTALESVAGEANIAVSTTEDFEGTDTLTAKGTDLTLTAEVDEDASKSAGVNISDQKSASKAITTINSAIETVSKERSKLGAVQNRLEHTIKNLDNAAENLQAAESRVRDVDMAREMMEFTKQNILQQASTAMLAQANQAPQTVLQLLR
ncbi:MAG: flagellin [Clostridiaceae bacterium]|nr:flagellin [Clostridiaceae bacterium]MBW4860014.1 flagellin [Clostridiaceae bacterium]MBW4867104.1 flagellin [Clostridiaceae bacterium]